MKISKSIFVAAIVGLSSFARLAAEPLKIGYSDWPGWVAWEIGIKKGWFKEAGVEVEFVWMDHVIPLEGQGGVALFRRLDWRRIGSQTVSLSRE